MAHLMHFNPLSLTSTVITSMLLVSLVVTQGSTSGPLLQLLMKLAHFHQTTVPVLMQIKPIEPQILLILWEMITSVIQEVKIGFEMVGATQMILCGMELVVGLSTHVVLSIILHGSTSSYHSPKLMILR